jgi:hypothetical protein
MVKSWVMQASALVVEDAVGRDVQPERLPEVVASLEHWCGVARITDGLHDACQAHTATAVSTM